MKVHRASEFPRRRYVPIPAQPEDGFPQQFIGSESNKRVVRRNGEHSENRPCARNWHGACDTFHRHAANRSKEIRRVMRVHRGIRVPLEFVDERTLFRQPCFRAGSVGSRCILDRRLRSGEQRINGGIATPGSFSTSSPSSPPSASIATTGRIAPAGSSGSAPTELMSDVCRNVRIPSADKAQSGNWPACVGGCATRRGRLSVRGWVCKYRGWRRGERALRVRRVRHRMAALAACPLCTCRFPSLCFLKGI